MHSQHSENAWCAMCGTVHRTPCAIPVRASHPIRYLSTTPYAIPAPQMDGRRKSPYRMPIAGMG
eukprot:2298708-Rhodomonas_salina.1